MVTMALSSRFTPRQRVDKNGDTALQAEPISVWLSLAPVFGHCLSTPLAPAEIPRAGTTWTRPFCTLAASSNRPGSHSKRSARTSKPHTIREKSEVNKARPQQGFASQFEIHSAKRQRRDRTAKGDFRMGCVP